MLMRSLLSISILSALVACGGSGGGGTGGSTDTTKTTSSLALDQWHIENTGTAPSSWGSYKTLTQGADMNVKPAWNSGAKGSGIVVTVVDDGVDFLHPDLKPQELAGYSMSYDANSPNSAQPAASASDDMHDHGTGVAGVIAAKEGSSGAMGIAPEAKLIGHRIMGMSSESVTTYSETKILTDGVSQVSNHSYGPTDNGRLHVQSTAEYDRIKALVTSGNSGKGHVMVFASGNGAAYVPRQYEPSEISSSYSNMDNSWNVNKNLGDYAGLDMTQQHPYVISVGGFDANNKTVSYSEAGPAVLVAGATGDQWSGAKASHAVNDPTTLEPDNADKVSAAAITTTGRANVKYPVQDTHRENGEAIPDSYNFGFNGTSAAAPMVTGVVALMQSANPNLTWRDIRWILAKTARKIQVGQNLTNQATGKESTGIYAKPIWSTTGNSKFGKYSHYLGYGAADAGAAVAEAKTHSTLASMKECDLTISNSQASIGSAICPSTIEFVQVKYQVASGTNISNESFSMHLANNTGKTINLLTPSTCQTLSCTVTADTSVKGGTVGFMGDTLDRNSDTFTFTKTNNITLQAVRVFGH